VVDIGFELKQQDGSPPTPLIDGKSPGVHGVTLLTSRFAGGAHFAGTGSDHLLCFHLTDPIRFQCRIGDRRLDHIAPTCTLAVCPAEAECSADTQGGLDVLSLIISAERLALAKAQADLVTSSLVERLQGSDDRLLALAGALQAEAMGGFKNGTLFWSSLSDAVIRHLVDNHLSSASSAPRTCMGAKTVVRLTDYIHAHIEEPIDLERLADIAGFSQFHFARMFRRTVGITPHRYVMLLRLGRAVGMVRASDVPLAEIALRAGFTDQSHLSRWIHQIHGLRLTQLKT
jgi:AraC family transcriptional regulator